MSRMRWVVAALVAACVLGACNDDPKPDIPDPTSSATSTSPTGSTPPSPPPSESLSPEDTVKAWVAAENAALRSGATSRLRNLSAKDCRGCENFPESIETVYGAGGSYEGGAWNLISTHLESSTTSDANVSAAISIAAGTTIPQAGADPVRYEAQNHLMSFELVKEGDAWQFTVIAFIS
jgi:hypothetical protein